MTKKRSAASTRLPMMLLTATQILVSASAIAASEGVIATRSFINGSWNIGLFDLSTGEFRLLTNSEASDGEPCFAPDGSSVAFSSTRSGNLQIWAVDVDGSNLRQLTTGPGRNGACSWSLDGSRIVFTSYRDGNGEIYSARPDGADQINHTKSAEDEFSGAMGEGGLLAFSGRAEGASSDIFAMNSDGTERRRVTFANHLAANPSWTRDGRILFSSAPDNFEPPPASQESRSRERDPVSGNEDIYVINPDGTGLTNLTNNGQHETIPVASPDGLTVAWFTRDLVHAWVGVVGIDGSGYRIITPTSELHGWPSWGPSIPNLVAVPLAGTASALLAGLLAAGALWTLRRS